MTDRPKLGEFTADRSPRKREEDPSSDALTPPAGEEEQAAEKKISLYGDIQEGLTPVEDYHAYLKELGISEEEAANIVDDIFTRGYYEETYDLTKKIKVTFRTRQHRDTVRIQTAMQIQQPVYSETLQELQIRYSLAASLARYGEHVFTFPSENMEEAFNKRLRFVEDLASAAVNLLSVKLARFDRKTAALCRSGVAEAF